MRVERNMYSMSEHNYRSLSRDSSHTTFSFQYRFREDMNNRLGYYSINPIITTQARFKGFSVKDVHDFPYSGYDQIAYVIDLYESSPDDNRIINFDSISDSRAGHNLENYSGLEND